MRTRNLVVVTGTPRSGTTPVGDVLGLAPGVRALYEPLNFHVGDRRVQRYFEVPGAADFSIERADEFVDDVRAVRLRLRSGIFPHDTGWRRVMKTITGSRTTVSVRRARLDRRATTILWKDPFALFWVRHLVERHSVPVVFTIRPPHAVAASFKRLDWGFDVAGVVERLDGGNRYAPILHAHSGRLEDPATNAALLWTVAHTELLRVIDHPLVHVVEVADLVDDPHARYRRLYDDVGLVWTSSVERALDRQAQAHGRSSVPLQARAHVRGRDVRGVNHYWKDVLTDAEAAIVSDVTGDVWDDLQAQLLMRF